MPLTFDVFDVAKMSLERILGLVALGAWAWDMLRRGGKLRRTPVDWLILAFLAWVALTTVTSIHWPTALFGKPRRYEGLLSFVNYAVIYFLVLQFAVDAARVRRLAQALFLSSLVVAGYGLLQYLGWDPVSWGPLPFEANRAFSTYGNPDLLGGFLIFSVTVALGLALFEARLWWRLAYWAGFGLNGLVLIVAFTRGAWIGGAVALAVLGVAAWRQRVRLFRIDWLPAGASLLVGIAAIVRSLSSSNEVMNFGKRLASIFEFRGGSGQTRTEIWQAAFAAIEERPVLGWGADTFRLIFPKFKPVEYVRDAGGQSVADNAHDYPLQLASGVGIPGMLLFYGVFVWAGVRSARTVFKRTGDPARILVAAFWAAAAGYLVQLFFGLSVTGVAFLLWIALAVVLAPTSREVAVRAPRWGAVAGVVVLARAPWASATRAWCWPPTGPSWSPSRRPPWTSAPRRSSGPCGSTRTTPRTGGHSAWRTRTRSAATCGRVSRPNSGERTPRPTPRACGAASRWPRRPSRTLSPTCPTSTTTTSRWPSSTTSAARRS